MRFQKMIEKWLKNDLFQSSKNEKMTLKKLLIFLEEMKLFNPKLQKLLFFLGEPLRDFHHCFFRCLHFTIDFYYCFWTFSLLIVLVHVTVSSGVFISPLLLLLFFKCFHFTNFLYRDCFLSGTSFLCCCTASATDLRELFSLAVVFTLHSFPTFGTTCFDQGFPEAGSFALKVAGSPTEVRNTDQAHLFVQQKVIVDSIYVLRPYGRLY